VGGKKKEGSKKSRKNYERGKRNISHSVLGGLKRTGRKSHEKKA